MKAYKVKVGTTNGLGDTFRKAAGGYEECERGAFYVVTDDPRKIFEQYLLVLSIEEIGFGYALLDPEALEVKR